MSTDDLIIESGPLEGEGTVIGKRAPDFSLPDQFGTEVTLAALCKQGPLILAFYPGDFTMVCTKQLCNYRDHMEDFRHLGLQVVGISPNPTYSHSRFAKKFDFDFKLLSDPNSRIARAYDCSSVFMFGRVSRAVFVINRQRLVLYRYVEPTILTHRSATELVGIVTDLKSNKLL
jgi:peroxiredoxin Q/BCP